MYVLLKPARPLSYRNSYLSPCELFFDIVMKKLLNAQKVPSGTENTFTYQKMARVNLQIAMSISAKHYLNNEINLIISALVCSKDQP